MPRPERRKRLLFIQTQAIAAGAQEISRILTSELSDTTGRDVPDYEIHTLFYYRITDAYDDTPNVHFCVQATPRGPLAIARFFLRLVRMIRRIRPDVVLTFQHYGNIFGAPAARLAGVPHVIANHVSAPATIGPATRLIDRILGRTGFYDVITVNSRQTWRDYQNYPASYAKRLVLVPHGFADKTSTLDKAAAREAFNLPADNPVIGSVARLHPLKCLDHALNILPALPDCHLAIAGQGPDAERLRELAGTLGIEDRLHFVGGMEPERIGDFLATLDAFVFPSSAETFGLAAVEAAQAGVPVIANDIPVLREVLEVDGKPCARLVDTSDAEAFAGAVTDILAKPDEAAELSRLGRRLSERHSLGAMVDAYRELIEGGSERAGARTRPLSGAASTSARP